MRDWTEQADIVRRSVFFDPKFYTETYPDAALSDLDPAMHYLRVGAWVGRAPGPEFDGRAYLQRYRDVAARSENPLVHFELWGRGEGRDPMPEAPSTPAADRIDVIVPVYNALDDVKACLTSLARAANRFDVRVLVINDYSDSATSDYLRHACPALSQEACRFELIEHDENRGYTVAVNTGLKASDAAYIATLNSDTIVTERWLDGLVDCMASEAVGVTGPLSNAASWQNVPTLMAEDGSGFAINTLPDGLAPDDMAHLVRKVSRRAYPRTTFLNGFCFLIRRKVLDAIGYMDEASFPFGYGEENDFCLRAQDAGFELAIADDVYVFHAKSKSFGHTRRTELSQAGSVAIRRKHGNDKFDAKVHAVSKMMVMDVVRNRVTHAINHRQAMIPQNTLDFVGRQRVLFLLPVRGGGGGAHSVVQEATAMRRMGVDVKIAVQDADYHNFIQIYGDIPEASNLFIGFRKETVVATAQNYDVVVATIYTSVPLLKRIIEVCSWILPAYYVQDYEPMFFETGSSDWQAARDSYTAIPDAVLIAKTDWICREVTREHGVSVHKIEPSIDHDVYSPPVEPRAADRPLHIAAMVRPNTPRRGPKRTMEVLGRLKQRFGEKIDIDIFGCAADDPERVGLRTDFDFTNHGVLTRPGVAALMRNADMFIDLSDYQAFGRTSLEAMACGVLAVVPRAGGGDEYAIHLTNALVVDTSDVDGVTDQVEAVLSDPPRMARMRMQGLATASSYSPRRAALSELMAFAPALAELRQAAPAPARPRVVLLPALTGSEHLSITGSGYVRLLQPYRQDQLTLDWDITVQHDGHLPEPGSANIAILQRDMLPGFQHQFGAWAEAWHARGGKLIYEIDDDLMDAEALRSRGYSGDAADLGERVRRYAAAADVITVSTPRLASVFSDHADKLELVPNYIDAELWKLDEDMPGPQDRSGPVVVGYVGTPTHAEDLAVVQDAVKALEAEGRIQIEVIGAFQRGDPLFGKRIGLPQNSVYPIFVDWLARVARWDIAIVPLLDSPFNQSKSNLKFIECAAMGTAIICSDTSEYARVVRHEENGLLVENKTEAWQAALTQLIDDQALRQRLARTAYQDVRQKLTVQANSDLYNRVLSRALNSS